MTPLGISIRRIFLKWGKTPFRRTFNYDSNCSTEMIVDGYLGAPSFQAPVLYDAYGKPSTALPAVTPVTGAYSLASSQPFQYKGQYGYYTEGGSGLIYCMNRFYDPNIGRWISRDPAGLDGGLNVYEYCEDNPIMEVDPDGLDSFQIREAIIFRDNQGVARFSKMLFRPSMLGAWKNITSVRDDFDNMSSGLFKAILTSNTFNSVTIVGHGNDGLLYYNIDDNDKVEADNLNKYAALRRKKHLPKLKCIDIEECCVCSDHYLVNALLELSDEVYGFEGWTVNPTSGARGKKYHYIKPFDNPPKTHYNDHSRNYIYGRPPH